MENALMQRPASVPAVAAEPVGPAQAMYALACDKDRPPLDPVYSYLSQNQWKPVPGLRECLLAYKQGEFFRAAQALVDAPHPFYAEWDYGAGKQSSVTGRHPLGVLITELNHQGSQILSLVKSSVAVGLEHSLACPIGEIDDLAQAFLDDDFAAFEKLARGPYLSAFPEFPKDDVPEAARRKVTYFTEWKRAFEVAAREAVEKYRSGNGIREDHIGIPQSRKDGRLEAHPAVIARALEMNRPLDERILDIELFARDPVSCECPSLFAIVTYAQPKGVRMIGLWGGDDRDQVYHFKDQSTSSDTILSHLMLGECKRSFPSADPRRIMPEFSSALERYRGWINEHNAFLAPSFLLSAFSCIIGAGVVYQEPSLLGKLQAFFASGSLSVACLAPFALRWDAGRKLSAAERSVSLDAGEDAKQLYGAALLLEDLTNWRKDLYAKK